MKILIGQTQNAKVGDTYERVRFEVQYFSEQYNNWVLSTCFRTIKETRDWIAEKEKERENMSCYIDLGKMAKLRIVKTVSLCEIVELIG